MDFNHYNSADSPLLAYDESVGKIDFDGFAIQYGEVKMLADIGPVPGPELQPVTMEDVVDSLVENFK